jgi:hypothetical protein
MEKNPGTMLIVVRHVRALEGTWEVCYREEPNNGADELQAMRKGIYLSLLRWTSVYALSALRLRRI